MKKDKETEAKGSFSDNPEETVTTEMDDMTHDVEFEEVNDEGEVDAKDTIKKLRAKIKTLEKEKGDYMLGWQRANADYANFKREGEERRKADISFASRRLILSLLPSLDAYDMARGNKESWESVASNWRVGIEYIFQQLIGVIEGEGVTQYGNVGDQFDPYKHESVESIPTENEKEDNTIASVLQKGYKQGENILRVSRVKVFIKNS